MKRTLKFYDVTDGTSVLHPMYVGIEGDDTPKKFIETKAILDAAEPDYSDEGTRITRVPGVGWKHDSDELSYYMMPYLRRIYTNQWAWNIPEDK